MIVDISVRPRSCKQRTVRRFSRALFRRQHGKHRYAPKPAQRPHYASPPERKSDEHAGIRRGESWWGAWEE